jgi:alpha-tubulin suppressor-like RCC1 family protein
MKVRLVASGLLALGTVAVAPLTAQAQAQTDTTYQWMPGGTPAPIPKMTDITAIAAGNGSYYALDGSGTVWAWGGGWHGALGQGNTKNHHRGAVKVRLPEPAVAIAESYNSGVAITAAGNVYGWGSNKDGDQCTGDQTEHNSPVAMTNLSHIVSAAGGGSHYIFLTSSGTLFACGINKDGQLGDGTFRTRSTPVAVDLSGLPDSPIVAISAGNDTSTVLLKDGEVWDWGDNKWGQLGDGTTTNSDIPVRVQLPSPAVQVYEGGDLTDDGQSLALLSNGQVWGWGNDEYGQLGNGSTASVVSVPIESTAMPSDVTSVVAGGTSGEVLDGAGNVWSFGLFGTTTELTPTKVLTGANMVSATAHAVMAHTP